MRLSETQKAVAIEAIEIALFCLAEHYTAGDYANQKAAEARFESLRADIEASSAGVGSPDPAQ